MYVKHCENHSPTQIYSQMLTSKGACLFQVHNVTTWVLLPEFFFIHSKLISSSPSLLFTSFACQFYLLLFSFFTACVRLSLLVPFLLFLLAYKYSAAVATFCVSYIRSLLLFDPISFKSFHVIVKVCECVCNVSSTWFTCLIKNL